MLTIEGDHIDVVIGIGDRAGAGTNQPPHGSRTGQYHVAGGVGVGDAGIVDTDQSTCHRSTRNSTGLVVGLGNGAAVVACRKTTGSACRGRYITRSIGGADGAPCLVADQATDLRQTADIAGGKRSRYRRTAAAGQSARPAATAGDSDIGRVIAEAGRTG